MAHLRRGFRPVAQKLRLKYNGNVFSRLLCSPKFTTGVRTKKTFLSYCCYGWIAVGLSVICLSAAPSSAQSRHVDEPFFVKMGIGFSDYTGDFPIQNTGHPLDFQEFIRGNGFPFVSSTELGYRPSQSFAVAFGLQIGNYPIVGYAGPNGLEDSNLYTTQLLGRYTFDNLSQNIAPYLDGGFNITFGGLRTGYGPTLGGGVNIPFNSSVSFFVESRFNFTYPDDAVDGADYSAPGAPDDAKGSITGPFDSINQLLGFGVKINFGGFSGEKASGRAVPSRVPPDTVVRTINDRGVRTARPDTSRHGDMIKVPSGTFIMGLTDEDPLSLQNAGRKRVTVSSFYIDQYEVTNAEYREYISQLSPDEREERVPDSTAWSEARSQESWSTYFRDELFSDHPVLAVTWNEARAYCQARNKRLPTEAEWEYAARGGHLGRVYPWEGISIRGENGQYLANFNPSEGYAADAYAFTAPVDAFSPNNWGLYNVAGNVSEWTRDAYTPSYDNISDFNPHHVDEGESRRVIRGGAWNSNSFAIGVGARDTQPRDEASVAVGFRCVQDVGSLNRERQREPSTETGTSETENGNQQ